MNRKVSIIIPARNEESCIKETIETLKKQDYEPKEIIVVVNNSNDRTYQIAKQYADKALNFSKAIGVSAARNEGVRSAEGEIFIFIDADSKLSDGAVFKVGQATGKNDFGSTLGKGDNKSIKGKIFFLYKNWFHILKIYEGVVDGVFFCHKDIFLKSGGFDENRKIAEFEDIIKRMKKAGGKYRLMKDCHAIVSLRRFEEKGYFKTHLFWLKWKLTSLFKKDNKLTGQYFNPRKQ